LELKTGSNNLGMLEKENNPLVSIIVITYNSSKYVLETLESAREQTYKNIELIVSDDASADNTVSICRQWIDENRDRFARVELITVPENTGTSANCNRGVKNAKGDWVKLIAGDDALLQNCIADNINYLSENSTASIIQSNVQFFEDTFEDNNFMGISQVELMPFFKTNITSKEQYRLILTGNKVIVTSVFIKKQLICDVDGFDEEIPLIEDGPFFTKVLRRNYKIECISAVTVKYRRHIPSKEENRGIVLSATYAKNLLIYSKKYKKGNVKQLHYYFYNLSLYLIIIYHKLSITRRIKLADQVFAKITKALRKVSIYS